MIPIDIPGYKTLQIKYLVLDVNGTLACDGKMIAGVQARIEQLQNVVEVFMITANAYGTQHAIENQLSLSSKIISPGNEAEKKAAFVKELGCEHVMAIGNGANDVLMLKAAALSVAVLGGEGVCTATLLQSDIVVNHIGDALDLLLYPARLRATLRH